MRRRVDEAPAEIPGWLLGNDGTLLADAAAVIRWCAESGWRKLDVLLEARRRRDAVHGIRRDRGAL